MNPIRICLKFVAIALFGLALTGCGGEEGQEASKPPPPPTVYIIKHYNANLDVIATHEAVSYQARSGCLSFQKVGDDTKTNHMICGFVEGYIKSKPDVPPAKLVVTYLVEHRKADGTVHKTHRASNYWIGEGCLFYNDILDQSTNSVICGFANGTLEVKKPKS